MLHANTIKRNRIQKIVISGLVRVSVLLISIDYIVVEVKIPIYKFDYTFFIVDRYTIEYIEAR